MPDLPRTAAELARLIDHTLLGPSARAAAIDLLCEEARGRALYSVCVNPCWVARAKQQLDGSEVRVCTVIGFPLGANASASKAGEARIAVEHGADELDMVMNVGWFLSNEHERVRADVAGVIAAAQGRLVKVILEIALLEAGMIGPACELAVAGGASFVKTSTGFGPGGATVEAVRAMRAAVGDTIGVKASGGIRDAAAARRMLEAGATRLGASASLGILDRWEQA
jgi:deoxyribose-phosphate aldolase